MGITGSTIHDLEGRLRIEVQLRARAVCEVTIESERPVSAGSLLEGRDVREALTLLPRLFPLCGVAQTAAGLAAVENAFEISIPPSLVAARSLLVAAEALEQTLWRLLMDWPGCVGMPPDATSMRDLRRLLHRIRPQVFGETPWNRIGGGRVAPDTAGLVETVHALVEHIDRALYPDPADRLQDADSFDQWIQTGKGPVASAIRYADEHGLADFGTSLVRALPSDPDTDFLAQQLSGDDDWSFCARPYYHDEVRETGALSRLTSDPLVSTLRERYGNGLITRMAARLVEIDVLISTVRQHITGLSDEPGVGINGVRHGRGIGLVDTARGLLVHWAEIKKGVVSRYRVLAPTEWNFHPGGPFVQGLRGAQATTDSSLIRNIDLLVNALDPCIRHDVSVREHWPCTR